MGRRWSIGGSICAALLALLSAPAAWACSTVSSYVRPSNFELAQIADAIVIATPVDARETGDPWGSTVRFRITETLKGEARGEVEVERMRIGRTVPSAPDDIRFSHPEGHAGPCNRMTVAKGASYILFLEQSGGAYATPGYPFSRESEDYAGEASIWARMVRTYVEMQKTLAPMAQVQKLEDTRAEILSAKARTPYERALAADIESHLGSISPWKPTEFLLAAYADHKAGKAPRYPPRKGEFDEEQSEAQALTEAIMEGLGGERAPQPAPRRSAFEARMLKSLIEGEHPGASPLFETFRRPGAPPDELGMAIVFFAKNGRYREAYDLVETRAVDLVSRAPKDEAQTLLWAIGEALQDPHNGEGPARWRSDPYTLERWPRLALRLTTLAESRSLMGPDYNESLLSLLGTDYGANPELTLALSGGANDIGDWAAGELANPENLRVARTGAGGTPADPLLLPLRIKLKWQGFSRDKEAPSLITAFCNGPVQRRTVFQEWANIGSSESVPVILRMAAAPVMEPADRDVLAAAVARWDQRHEAEIGESRLADDKALQKLARGEPITRADIAPLTPAACGAG